MATSDTFALDYGDVGTWAGQAGVDLAPIVGLLSAPSAVPVKAGQIDDWMRLALNLVKHFEGCVLRAYRCPAGVLTIGFGHTGPDVTRGMTITKEEAERLFIKDMARFIMGVDKLTLGKVGPAQRAAFVSLSYNIGLAGFGKSTALKRALAGKHERVPEAMTWWNKVDGEAVAGLTRRRRAEAALYRGDLDEAERYLGADIGDMPQRVDVPAAPKNVAQTTTAGAAVLTGSAGAIGTIAGAKAVVDGARQASELAGEAVGIMQSFWSLGPWVLILFLIAGGVVWIIRERNRRLHEDRV